MPKSNKNDTNSVDEGKSASSRHEGNGEKSPRRSDELHNGSSPVDINVARKPKLSARLYRKELRKLQTELVSLQEWIKHKKLRVVVLFEGRDAAGKGGVIKRINERLNPRVCRVVALTTPTEREKKPMVLPTLRISPASRRRNGSVRPQLV